MVRSTLNCSQNSHGVTLQSPPHASGATYTLILPTSFGGAGDVLTSAGANPSQLVWTTPTTGTVTGTGTENYVTKWSTGGAGIQNSTIFDNGTNVGIGTTSPSAPLEVLDSLFNDPGLKISASSANFQAELNLNRLATNRAARITYALNGANQWFAGVNYNAGNPVNDYSISTSDNLGSIPPSFLITSTGNVGIGTSSPSAKLDVAAQDPVIRITNTKINLTTGDLIGGLEFFTKDASVGASRVLSAITSSNTTTSAVPNGDLIFKTSTGGGGAVAATEKMRITPVGKVGIGTTNPGHKLSVFGGNIQTDGIVYTNVIRDNTGGNVSIQDNGGNVGIGTTSPEAALHARQESATILVQDTRTGFATTEAYIKFSGSVVGGNFRTDIEQSIGIKDNSLVFARAGSENMRIDSSGNVGIGTTSPAVSLDISATDAVQMPVGITTDRPLTGVSNGMLRYNSTNNEFEGYINGNWGSIGGGAAGGLVFRGTFDASTGAIASGGSLYTCPAGGSGGTVDTAIGDLYIVTTAGSFFCSGTSLNVGDEVICITAATATNDNVNNWNAIASGAGGAVTGSGTTNYVPKFTGATVVGNSSIFNDASGNVGIGTTSPSTKLEVDGEALLGNGTDGVKLTYSSGNSTGIIDTGYSSTGLEFRTSNVERMRIDSSGNVGIGTTVPSQKLEVNGRVKIGDINYAYGGQNFHINMATSVGGGDSYLSNINGQAILAAGGYYYGGNLRKLNAGVSNYSAIKLNAQSTGDIHFESIVGATAGSNWDATTNMSILGGGNVGIGTTSPGKTLEVKSTGNTAIRISTDGDAGDQPEIQFYRNTGDYAVVKHKPGGGSTSGLILTNYRLADSNIIFNTAGENERMRIDSSGNVGIGTDSPEVSLDLGSNTDAIRVPNGPIADRPSGILPGMIRYNTSSNEFEGYSGTLNVSGSWGALGGGSLPTKTVDTFTGSGQVFIDLTVEASSVNYIDMYIDGVYQAKATYTIATPGGTGISRLTLVSGTFPTGVSIETVTTT